MFHLAFHVANLTRDWARCHRRIRSTFHLAFHVANLARDWARCHGRIRSTFHLAFHVANLARDWTRCHRRIRSTFHEHRSQRGYTFTEILVVIAVIGILVALLLPAVQAAREAARRLNCSKNLEQLILAVHNYEMLHQVYPPGTINQTGPIQSLPQGYHHNWIIQLLPYLEQKNAYAHVDDLVGVYHANNAPVRRLDIATLRCPSAPVPGRGYTDYAGVHNDVEAPIDVTNNGTFFLNSRISYFDLKDGSSHTLFIGEKETYAGDLGWMSGTRATLRNTGLQINASGNWRKRRYWPRPTGHPPGLDSDGSSTAAMLADEDTLNMLFGEEPERLNHFNVWSEFDQRAVIPEQPIFDEYGMYGEEEGMYGSDSDWDSGAEAARDRILANAAKNPALAVGGFGSEHPGGAQFAMGDGSVRFYSETTDGNVLLQLGHRADGRLVYDDY